MMTNRRAFLRAVLSCGAVAGLQGCGTRLFTGARRDYDEHLTVFLSDLHVRSNDTYQYRRLAQIVQEILRMDPLPRRVVVFGDIAYLYGQAGDYRTSASLLRLFVDAGIELTLGMGNHDRRSNFLAAWPEYHKRLLMSSRIVSSANLGPADLLMLDGLQGTDTRGETDSGPVPGALDQAQQEWLKDRIDRLERPTFFASHFPISELRVCGKPLSQALGASPLVAGYIHGHDHRWYADWCHRGWGKDLPPFRTLCLPSTGHWGDIGYTTFRTSGKVARAAFVQKDFYFPKPEEEGSTRKPVWDDIMAEHNGAACVFRIP